jgi:hypothetical protein
MSGQECAATVIACGMSCPGGRSQVRPRRVLMARTNFCPGGARTRVDETRHVLTAHGHAPAGSAVDHAGHALSDQRRTSRNGYRDRRSSTRDAAVDRRMPSPGWRADPMSDPADTEITPKFFHWKGFATNVTYSKIGLSR